jgi:hypothetical protein
MAKTKYRELMRFIRRAWEAESAKKEDFGATIVNVGPGWPQASPEIIAGIVNKEIGSVAKSRRQLKWRLKSIRYPYIHLKPPSKSSDTFLRRVRKERILDVITTPPVLWNIRRVWFNDLYRKRETKNRERGVSQFGYPLMFHNKVMHAIWRHRKSIEKLAKGASIPKDWLAEYLAATQKQILKEARNYYPQFLGGFRTVSQISLTSVEVDVRLELFHALEDALKKKGIVNHSLCHQLTALICTPSNLIRQRRLIPTPQNILENVRDEK